MLIVLRRMRVVKPQSASRGEHPAWRTEARRLNALTVVVAQERPENWTIASPPRGCQNPFEALLIRQTTTHGVIFWRE